MSTWSKITGEELRKVLVQSMEIITEVQRTCISRGLHPLAAPLAAVALIQGYCTARDGDRSWFAEMVEKPTMDDLFEFLMRGPRS